VRLNFILFYRFCDVAQVAIVHKIFRQIWLYSKYECKKILSTFSRCRGSSGDFWRMIRKNFLFGAFFSPKNGTGDRIFLLQDIFRKMSKIQHKNKIKSRNADRRHGRARARL
jgi:hypothetical protein